MKHLISVVISLALLLISLPVLATNGTLFMGADHACVLEGGKVSCFGVMVGDSLTPYDNYNTFAVPVTVTGVTRLAVAAWADQACAIGDGGLSCWGQGQVDLPADLDRAAVKLASVGAGFPDIGIQAHLGISG